MRLRRRGPKRASRAVQGRGDPLRPGSAPSCREEIPGVLDFHHPDRTDEEKAEDPHPSRGFSVQLLGFLTADLSGSLGRNGSALRPVWIAYAGTERESSPFTANLRAGRKAGTTSDALEIPSARPHRWSFQKVPGGVVTVAYIPSLFHLEPVTHGGESRSASCSRRPAGGIAEQAGALAPDFGDEAWRRPAPLSSAPTWTAAPPSPSSTTSASISRSTAPPARPAGCTSCPEAGEGKASSGEERRPRGLDAPVALSVGQPALADFLIATDAALSPGGDPPWQDPHRSKWPATSLPHRGSCPALPRSCGGLSPRAAPSSSIPARARAPLISTLRRLWVQSYSLPGCVLPAGPVGLRHDHPRL